MTQATTGRDKVRLVAEYGPLAVFFIAYFWAGLMTATAALMAATLVAVAVTWWTSGRVPAAPVLTLAVVLVFGGLTLWLRDETFIKMKPTIIQAIFAVVLLGGLAAGRPLLKPLLGGTLPLDDAGWRRLTLRFALFFAAMALLNEIVWRSFSTDVWVSFKVFGLIGLTIAFMLAQMPLLQRHRLPDQGPDE